MLLVQLIERAFSRALLKAGNSMAAKMAMMAITTSNSMSVKDFRIADPLGFLLVNYQNKSKFRKLLQRQRTPRAAAAKIKHRLDAAQKFNSIRIGGIRLQH
jgi:hypothetical protein